jgi:hypothetical protein
VQAIHTFRAEPLDPFGNGLWRSVELACSRCRAQPTIHYRPHHLLSTFRREASILVRVHSVPANRLVWRLQRSPPGPNGQPPGSSHLADLGARPVFNAWACYGALKPDQSGVHPMPKGGRPPPFVHLDAGIR